MRRLIIGAALAASAACGPAEEQAAPAVAAPRVVVVGASLAGLSAAIEAARAGADVAVLDMNSVAGGHGIQTGGVAIIGSPLQEQLGHADSPERAYRDWLEWTENPNLEWMRYYVAHSREEIWDFLIPMGVVFDRINPSHGNSVPRFHMTHRRGLNLIRPLFRESLRYPTVHFEWNTMATELLLEEGRVSGVIAHDMRTREIRTFEADAVILATGGFQRSAEMIQEHWDTDAAAPERILSGSGKYSLGIGHRMAGAAGAALIDMHRQYNNYSGIPDPRDPSGQLALGVSNPRAVWVNREGRRFVNPLDYDRDVYAGVLAQPGSTYWAIFDDDASEHFGAGAADWADRPLVAARILDDPSLVRRADTLEELAALTGLPAGELIASVRRHNELVESGENDEYGPFAGEERTASPQPLVTPPFYAFQAYIVAHKNMGGVAIDLQARALNADGEPVPGLYAAGEITGSAGINGIAGLDGTFTGPAVLIGRVAGRWAVADVSAGSGWQPRPALRLSDDELLGYAPARDEGQAVTMDQEELARLLRRSRDGYWHFEQVHESVLRRQYACTQCHSAATPTRELRSRFAWYVQMDSCDHCHLGPQIR